jgi:uncharacterized lipoprotein YmbA
MKKISCLSLGMCLAWIGCWSPTVTYYSLQPSAEAARFTGSALGPVVEVRRVRFPTYLNNPQMVTRLDREMRVDESNRWVEDLGTNFQRTFAQDLAARLGSSAVFVSGNSDRLPSKVVQLDVVRFDVNQRGLANLTVNYTVSDTKRFEDSTSVVTVLEEPIEGKGYNARVAALSVLVDRLSDEVARAVRG